MNFMIVLIYAFVSGNKHWVPWIVLIFGVYELICFIRYVKKKKLEKAIEDKKHEIKRKYSKQKTDAFNKKVRDHMKRNGRLKKE